MKNITLLSVFLLMTSLICAQPIQVPGDHSSIQAAIEAASDGDTVLVAEGTYFENINFKGKPITVGSQFLLDGDTSHISRTIIDGSQFTNPDSASTVMMCSGEDTTSVLTGFTITGGKGTLVDSIHVPWPDLTYIAGGGILIYNSGGKIAYNLIKDLQITDPSNKARGILGGGIAAMVNHNHTAIIRFNIIRDNRTMDGESWGGGMSLHGGRLIVEHNAVVHNMSMGTGIVAGPGILFENEGQEGTIEEAIIRNNIIMHNVATSTNNLGLGGGMTLNWTFDHGKLEVYNNIIAGNSVEGYGGGIYGWDNSLTAHNNTIINNLATIDGNSLYLDDGSNMVLFNNIIWSEAENGVPEIGFWDVKTGSLKAYYNIHSEPFDPKDPITGEKNMMLDPLINAELPVFLPPNSPSIGRAIDSLKVDGTWLYVPTFDFLGNQRPGGPDSYPDIGAIESPYPRTILSNADLDRIGLWDWTSIPSFNKDTLNYLLGLPDTASMVPTLEVEPADWVANVAMVPATDLVSINAADRTTSITVTADDGTTQKMYTVLFNLLSTDAKLGTLSIDRRSLEPEFDPEVSYYKVWLPSGSTETPELDYKTSHPNATVEVFPALDITSARILLRTTNIKITPEAGKDFQMNYWIEFNVDMNPPKVTLASDTVIVNDTVKVICSQSGLLYLVSKDTDASLDSIHAHMLDSMAVMINDTVYMPSSGMVPGEYWLYATNQYESVSEPVALFIFATGITEIAESNIHFYPIPVEDLLFIDTERPILSIEVYNSIGALLMNKSWPGNSLHMEHLDQGIYFIRIRTQPGKFHTVKVIKN